MENRKLDRNQQIAAAYINAQLGNVDPKKFPKLEEILGEKRKVADQTPAEFSAAMMRWARANGLTEDQQDNPDT